MMNPSQAKITYLYHSGFGVETAHSFLIFDYYQPFAGIPQSISNGIITAEYLKTKSNVYVFASHRHRDHFDQVILEWAKANPTITYILSSDINIKNAPVKHHILSAYEKYSDNIVSVTSFGSTDEGISFGVQVDGLTIFHAGDLNWWHWKEETPAERATAESRFKAEMEKISGQPIDIAFFPVDRRLEEFYAIGAEYFAAKLHPKLLLPMHFGKDFEATQAFAQRAKELSLPTVTISHEGQEFDFPF